MKVAWDIKTNLDGITVMQTKTAQLETKWKIISTISGLTGCDCILKQVNLFGVAFGSIISWLYQKQLREKSAET